MVLPHAACPYPEVHPRIYNVFDISLLEIILRYDFRHLGHAPMSFMSVKHRRTITNVDHPSATFAYCGSR